MEKRILNHGPRERNTTRLNLLITDNPLITRLCFVLVIQLLHKHQLTKLCAVCLRILFNLIRAREGIEDSFCWKIPWTQFLAPGKLYKLSETYFRSICKTFSLSWCTLLQMLSCAIGNGRNQCYAYSKRLQGWAFVTNRPDRAWKYQGKTCKSSPFFFSLWQRYAFSRP